MINPAWEISWSMFTCVKLWFQASRCKPEMQGSIWESWRASKDVAELSKMDQRSGRVAEMYQSFQSCIFWVSGAILAPGLATLSTWLYPHVSFLYFLSIAYITGSTDSLSRLSLGRARCWAQDVGTCSCLRITLQERVTPNGLLQEGLQGPGSWMWAIGGRPRAAVYKYEWPSMEKIRVCV